MMRQLAPTWAMQLHGPKVPQVMKFSALENIISSHLGDENIAGERPQDASYVDLYHPVADLYRGLFRRICPMRMALAPAWRTISELQIPQFCAAHLDLWPRSPGILTARPVRFSSRSFYPASAGVGWQFAASCFHSFNHFAFRLSVVQC
jgi:hypothetical protein